MKAEIERQIEGIEKLLAGSSGQLTGLLGFLADPPISDPLAWSIEVRKIYGDRVQIMGFWAYENPQAGLMGELRERHDFAILDGRWLIDGWITRFHGDESPGVLDLEDEGDLVRGAGIYGDRLTWERDLDLEQRADLQAGIAPVADMEPESFGGAIQA